MARVLIVGPQHSDQDRSVVRRLKQWATDSGHEASIVQPDGKDFLVKLRSQLQSSDGVLAVLDGSPIDPLTTWALGLAFAMRRVTLALRSDARPDGLGGLKDAFTQWTRVSSWNSPEVKQSVTDFLGGIRVFAGALVRDAVPKILREQGQELRFRQVADGEYPRVLKRKVVETAQRLEEADFGVEQEEIADVLELLETLINIRQYDRESLRSIKEGKWRRRGGFQKGYLLEEEPAALSR